MHTVPDVVILGTTLVALFVALRAQARVTSLESRLDSHIRSAAKAPTPPSATPSPEAPPRVPLDVAGNPPKAAEDEKRREALRQLAAQRATHLDQSKPAAAVTPAPARIEPPRATSSSTPAPATAATAAPRFDLEKFLSTRLLVWIAAAAVALAGIFFVKHSYERGLISPGLRLIITSVFGVSLLVAATFLRRRIANIAQALAAAGVAVLFGAVLAGTWFEQMLPPVAATACMVVVTALAVLLSLRHGPLVAAIGLVGGLVTPVLIGPGQLPTGVGLVYLLLLEAGIVLITRRRGWWPLSAIMLVGSLLWALVWLLVDAWTAPLPLLGLFVLVAAGGFIATTLGRPTVALPAPVVTAMRLVGGLFAVALITAMAPVGDFGLMPWIFVGVLGLGTMALARFDPRCLPLPALMLAASVCLLWLWATTLPVHLAPLDADIVSVTLGFGLLFGLGAILCLWKSRHPELWCALSLAAVLAHLLSARELLDTEPAGVFGGIAVLLAMGYDLLTAVVLRRRATRPRAEHALTVLAIGIAVLIALGIYIELPGRWIGIAWSLQAALLVPVHRRVRITGGPTIIAAVAALAGVSLLAAPGPAVLKPVGPVVLNFVTFAYGLPLLTLAAGATLLRRMPAKGDDRRLATGLELLAAVLGLACVTLNVRYGFHASLAVAPRIGMLEAATYCVAALVCVHVLFALARGFDRHALSLLAMVVLVASAAALIVGPMLGRNPAFFAAPVGAAPVFNWLLYVYGLPAVLLSLVTPWLYPLALNASDDLSIDLRNLRPWVSGAAFVLFFTLITLEVRQGFHGSLLNTAHAGEAELYAYSAAWTVFGLLLLIGGLIRRRAALRWASLAVLILTAAKVFLYDMRELEDLYRVFAFLGLGAVLLALTYLYQHFVFRAAAEA